MSTAKSPKERPDFGISLYAYAGKRLDLNGQMKDALIEVNAAGEQIQPEVGEWLTSKFNYVKRPRIGAIYEVKWANAEQKSFYKTTDVQAYKGMVSASKKAEWELEDEVSRIEEGRKKAMNKELSKSALAGMTLEQLREKMRVSSYQQRIIIQSIIIEFLNK